MARLMFWVPPPPLSPPGEPLPFLSFLALLRAQGHDAALRHGFDATAAPAGGLLDGVAEVRPDAVVVLAHHRTASGAREAVRVLRAGAPDLPVFCHGYAATLNRVRLTDLGPAPDAMIVGEGDAAVLAIAEALSVGGDWRVVPGLHRPGHGLTAPPRPIQELDTLPDPARDDLPRVLAGGGQAALWTSRGCYARCRFCPVSELTGAGWRARQAERVVDEIQRLVDDFGVTQLEVVDDEFIGPRSWGRARAMQIADGLVARGLGLEWSCFCRADDLEPRLLARLVEAGLRHVFVGVESAAPTALRRYRKGTSRETNRRAAEVLATLGVGVRPGLIAFDPFTTLDELRETLDFLAEVGWKHHLRRTCLLVLPGTPMARLVQTAGCRPSGPDVEPGLIPGYEPMDVASGRVYRRWGTWLDHADAAFDGLCTRAEELVMARCTPEWAIQTKTLEWSVVDRLLELACEPDDNSTVAAVDEWSRPALARATQLAHLKPKGGEVNVRSGPGA